MELKSAEKYITRVYMSTKNDSYREALAEVLAALREAVTKQKEYEQFMEHWQEAVKIAGAVKDIGAERIAELVQADREGRIHIIPIPRRNTCGKCGNFVRVSGRTYGECKLRPHYKPYQSRVCCSKYFENALEEMEDAQK